MPKGIDGRLLWRRIAPLLACLLVVVATVAFAGCGDSGDSDSGSTGATSSAAPASTQITDRRVVPITPVKQDRFAYARARFVEICAGCHRLADAGARGRRYNLDHGGGIEETHVRSTILHGEPGMPAFRDVLSEREFEEIVAYLVAVSRRTGGDDYWNDQLALRGEGEGWTRADTERLEAYARRLARRKG